MAIFNSYVKLPEGKNKMKIPWSPYKKTPVWTPTACRWSAGWNLRALSAAPAENNTAERSIEIELKKT